MPGQVVDTATAQEFRAQVDRRLSPEEAAAIGRLLEAKAARFHAQLGEGRAAERTPQELGQLLRGIFGVRGRADALVAALGERLPVEVDRLLHGDDELSARFDRFCGLVGGVPGLGFHVPAELLHFTYPNRFWLWTRWMWDPGTGTGALRLVVEDDVDLQAGGPGATYLRVGEAVAFVEATGKAAGFATAAPGLLGTDLFLACVYGVYMFTVLRVRMTTEFTRIVPGFPELVRRLLGVRRGSEGRRGVGVRGEEA